MRPVWPVVAAWLLIAPMALAQEKAEPPEDGSPASPAPAPDTAGSPSQGVHAPHKKKKEKEGAPGSPAAQPGEPAPAVPGAGSPAAPASAPQAPSAPAVLKPRGAGPWDHDLLVARLPAADAMKGPSMGLSASVDTKVFDRGGVACLARDSKARLVAAYQWFPQNNPANFDRIAIRTSSDEGRTWSGPRAVNVVGLPSGAVRPCDPTLVLLEDGRLRLYFTSHMPGGSAATYSAVSPAADGQTFVLEPGARFADAPNDVLDCAVARLGDTWHYFAPMAGPDATGRLMGYHATSKDGLRFERQADVSVDQTAGKGAPIRHRWLGCAVAAADGRSLRFFGSLDGAPGLWSARSSNGSDWRVEDVPAKFGMDPAAVELKDGGMLLMATSPPRPGTPSAKPREPGRP